MKSGGSLVEYNKFEDKFIKYAFQFNSEKAKIHRFRDALRSAVLTELPKMDNCKIFLIRNLTNSTSLNISHISPDLMCKYSPNDDSVLIGTLTPAWSEVWRNISTDEFTSDLLWMFFHVAHQYLHRGLQINIIGAIALTYGRHCDFRYGGVYRSIYPIKNDNAEYLAFKDSIIFASSKRNKLFNKYLNLINSFDPFVNRCLYYYVRSLSLRFHDYTEEVITATDNAIDVVVQAVKQRKKLPTIKRDEMHRMIECELSLPNETYSKLDYLYKLRCEFSAHPAKLKWWDFSEIFEKDVKDIMETVKSVVVKFLIYESNNRNIEKAPIRWSEWFLKHCNTLYDVIWHHNLPKKS